MSKRQINNFITMSEKVSNEHEIMSESAVIELLKENFDNYSYIHLPSYDQDKDCEIGEQGIGTAVVEADFGIMETGSVVVDSVDEKVRLATCLAEHLIVILKASCIVTKLEKISKYMYEKMSENAGYITFITGASRTADIERVLTIGVHGPVTMKIIIIED